MTDFSTALRHGLVAFREAREHRAQIVTVLRRFDEQIRRATGERVGVHVEPDLASKTANFDRDDPLGRSLVAYAERLADGQREALFTVDLLAEGFPATLHYDRLYVQCDDEHELEQAIEEFLKTPYAGAILIALAPDLLASANDG